ncbi:Fanconi anemia group A protein isoform 2 [Corchorus olitorius]|uniref:Fanconi anemia group A protein isoform 2 n=1 Tax=Corchorus olitorius TaxID=93759 RepID=A0A1R3JZ32_9ROSI|nr:Fanconi anemia group A protein isoform 2 [Corchorus olitorius]
MAPNSPKIAPDAPTDTRVCFFRAAERADIKLPPKPESTYKSPILTANIFN